MITYYSLLIKLFLISLFLSILPIGNLSAQEQELSKQVTFNETPLNESTVVVKFQPPHPPGDPKPINTVGGGSRDSGRCLQDSHNLEDPSLTPLMPSTRQGLTVAEYPTFFVYVPKTSATKALFAIEDETEDYYYQTTVSIPREAGIVSFKLPTEAQALEIGKSYKWAFIMICGAAPDPGSPGVAGWIERVESNRVLGALPEDLQPLKRVALYGQGGIWYDVIASLADLRRSQPDDLTLTSTWKELLRSVGLEAIATKPLL